MTDMSDVDLETGKVQVEVFTQTDAALAKLREECATTPDFWSPDGYDEGKTLLNRLVKYRTTLEKERKRIKAPYLEAGQIIDAEAKRITADLLSLEIPLSKAKQEVDEREKRLKEERIAKLQMRIDAMRDAVRKARGQNSAEVAELIDEIDAIDTQGDFYELTDEAVKAQREVLDELGSIYSDRLQFEQAEADRAEAERERARQQEAQAIEQRINAIRMAPLDLMGKPAVLIRAKIAEMEYNYPATGQYGDRAHEAEQAHEQALTQLRGMQAQAEALETAQEEEKRQAEDRPDYNPAVTTEPETTHTTDASPSQLMDAMAEVSGADQVTTQEAIAESQAKLERFNAAAYDIQGILESVTGHSSREQAEMVLNDIIAGEVRHVHFDPLDGE